MIENPVAFTLSLQEKLQDPNNYPLFEIMDDYTKAVALLQQQIQVIQHLKARVTSADALIDVQAEEISEHSVQIFNKDMEIFNLQSQFDKLNEKGTHGEQKSF